MHLWQILSNVCQWLRGNTRIWMLEAAGGLWILWPRHRGAGTGLCWSAFCECNKPQVMKLWLGKVLLYSFESSISQLFVILRPVMRQHNLAWSMRRTKAFSSPGQEVRETKGEMEAPPLTFKGILQWPEDLLHILQWPEDLLLRASLTSL